ncbi:MAG: isopentenyl-diphosphate Delta-isomerase [Rhodobacteraceae bacterium]|nr:isopentenyl-diphosphate Delta-isomerase [Paracoccaceae bacterium]
MSGGGALIPAWVDGRLVPFDKLGAHLAGHRHKAVSVFVFDGEQVLIQRRALSKYHTPGLWANTCCTHPHWNETAEDCAARRLDEELGIAGLALFHRGQVEYRADVGKGMTEHEVVDIFTAIAPAGPTVRPNPDEVMETRWIGIAELLDEIGAKPDRFTPWLRIYMAEHRPMILARAG